jgi:alkanesulfonate monooxygenase
LGRPGGLLFDAIDVYSTCPQSKDGSPGRYLDEATDIARWSESAGCHGILVYTDNQLVDPWLVAQTIIERTERIRPLVAVQPIAMHPYTAAKLITSLSFLHGRAVDLNMLAGGFKNDLVAMGDTTPHDDRYERTAEYTTIITELLSGRSVTFDGRYYHVSNLSLTPRLPEELMPKILISGSSDAGMAAAEKINATAVRYPRHVDEESDVPGSYSVPVGVRVGIVARATTSEAWDEAHYRFPDDRRGQITHQLAMKVSDSQWHRQLSSVDSDAAPEDPYWLGPFENSHTFCPYLVGSYDTVADAVARYVNVGFRTFILDIPPSEAELAHIAVVFREAVGS